MFPFLRTAIQAAETFAVKNAVEKVINNQSYYDFLDNPSVEAFEKKLSEYLDTPVIGVDSGTEALILALKLLKIGGGDEVIVPAFSFIGTVSCIPWVGATPVFVDVGENYAIDPEKIEEKITNKTKAIVVVHLYGQPANNLEKIIEIAKKRFLYVIEDAAQSMGARVYINGAWKYVGTLGDIGCLSFSSSKILAAPGRGGAIIMRNTALREELHRMRFFGAKHHYRDYPTLGVNVKLQEIQAAALLAKFQFFEYWLWHRKQLAAYYTRLLKNIDEISFPEEHFGTERVWYRYVIRTKRREELLEALKPFTERAFHFKPLINYPVPLPYFSIFKHLNHKSGDFPVADILSAEVLSLPITNLMSTYEVNELSRAIIKFFGKKN